MRSSLDWISSKSAVHCATSPQFTTKQSPTPAYTLVHKDIPWKSVATIWNRPSTTKPPGLTTCSTLLSPRNKLYCPFRTDLPHDFRRTLVRSYPNFGFVKSISTGPIVQKRSNYLIYHPLDPIMSMILEIVAQLAYIHCLRHSTISVLRRCLTSTYTLSMQSNEVGRHPDFSSDWLQITNQKKWWPERLVTSCSLCQLTYNLGIWHCSYASLLSASFAVLLVMFLVFYLLTVDYFCAFVLACPHRNFFCNFSQFGCNIWKMESRIYK